MIEFFASEPHYVDHLAPILRRLQPSRLLVIGRAIARAEELELDWERGAPRAPGGPVVVASARDYAWTNKARRIAYVEHGAGQTYTDTTEPGYAGSSDMDRLALVLTPGPHATQAWKRAYPELTVAEVGPLVLDQFFVGGAVKGEVDKPTADPFTVAFTFHWPCRRSHESGTAYHDWMASVRSFVADTNHRVLGHWHPKWDETVMRAWERMDVGVASYDDVMLNADLLVADNTSMLFEFAALGKPVLCLNATRWRIDVEHGLRFWTHAPGNQLWPGHDLATGVGIALAGGGEHRRIIGITEAYGETLDGRAGERAAILLMAWEAGWTS